MKKHLLALACIGMLPAFAAFALDGEGTAEDPYQITSAADFADMSIYEDGDYFILMNDIDLAGISFIPCFPVGNQPHEINFDGNNHVIKNLTSTHGYASLFGNVNGTIKNLGIENVNVNAGMWGPGGAFAGYCGQNGGTCTLENCYSTGTVQGYFAGGIAGGVDKDSKIIIKNCYSQCNCTSGNFLAGGLIASVSWGSTAEISNSYASGDIISNGPAAGGIIGGTSNYDPKGEHGDRVETAILNNVIAWNDMVNCYKEDGHAGAICSEDQTYTVQVTATDVYVIDWLEVNGSTLEDGTEEEEIIKIATGWEGWASTTVDEKAVLAWQVGETGGFNEIVADEAEDAAEYFNLQGVKVANPENGLYIVRRGNTVTKVIR